MIRLFFGKPGVGKSTLCCKLAKKASKGRPTYINFQNTVPNTYSCTLEDLGEWSFQEGAYAAIDESSIEYNNRSYKSMPKPTICYMKKHRHYKVDMDFFSQSHEDTDVTIRRLADQLWYMQKIGPWTLCRRVYKFVMVDQVTHQIIDGYKMASLLWLLVWPIQLPLKICPVQQKFMLTFRPFYYKYFNSWDTDNLPVKTFPIFNPIGVANSPFKKK